MSVATLLPPNATGLERAIDVTAGERMSGLPAVVASLWNAATCPEKLLAHLAWAMSVDEWSNDWSVERKRATIAAARDIHRHKGTPWAVKKALSAIGQQDAVLIERGDYTRRNGSFARDGSRHRKGTGGWASIRVVLSHPATVDQAYQIKRQIESVKRNCVVLTAIDFKQSMLRHNGQHTRNGAYTRGVVNTTL